MDGSGYWVEPIKEGRFLLNGGKVGNGRWIAERNQVVPAPCLHVRGRNACPRVDVARLFASVSVGERR